MTDADAPTQAVLDLAAAYGIATDYWDWRGRHVPVDAETVVAVLRALGVDASDDERAAGALAAAGEEPWRRVLPATVVLREGWTPWVFVHVPHGTSVDVWLELEDATTRDVLQVDHVVDPRSIDGTLVGEAAFELPADLPLGWHTLHAALSGGATATATVVVTPRRLTLPAAMTRARVWGLMAQLYQVRSARSWGIGDLSDLAELGSWACGHGASFVLVNPLHAAEPAGPMEPSPYLPTTRRFSNPVYLRIEEVPEYAYLSSCERARVDAAAAAARTLNAYDTVDRDAVWSAKRAALEVLHRAATTAGRHAAFERYVASQGDGLRTYATWCAIADEFGALVSAWPTPLRDVHSPVVAAYASSHEDVVDFHMWCQWAFDEAMGRTQQALREAGMSLGIVNDLAVGVHAQGADAWGLADVLADGVTVGAPPDQFNQRGQNWHQPPWHPRRLADAGYAPFRDMVRAVLRDSGGIRVDHIIGLFRLWWVPEGMDASCGAYVRYDHEALIGILVLEAQRAGAVVVGEDLGVVEPTARDVLRERGILGTSILWFEWTSDGRPLPPEDYRSLCLTTVTTHDLPPTAGYLDLAHVALRDELGLLTRPVEQERAVEQRAVDEVRAALRERGLLTGDASTAETVVALHRYLAQSPSVMLGVSVSDLAGDRRIVNQPGTDEEYPNWRIPLSGPDGALLGLEELQRSDVAGPVIAAVAATEAV